MMLDANHHLGADAVQAISDLFAPLPEAPVDDVDLLRLSLGVADAPTRLRCAEAVLASPSAAGRVVRWRNLVEDLVDEAPLSEQGFEDLTALAAFKGPFSREDAASVFPERFELGTLLPGWLSELEDGLLTVPVPVAEALAHRNPDLDAAQRERFVVRLASTARSIERTIAEGRWEDGSFELRRRLPSLRAAWQLADDDGQAETAETFVRAVLKPLMEIGATEEFAELLQVGYRTAERLGSPALRSFLLSTEGVAASRDGDTERAVKRWTERLELNRREGEWAKVADGLIDLAIEARDQGDSHGFEQRLQEAERVLDGLDRADLEANVIALRAALALNAGAIHAAIEQADEALDRLNGVDGVDQGLFVKASAARTLIACGQTIRAIAELVDAVRRCSEAGRPLHAAHLLKDLADGLEAEDRRSLALRCLEMSFRLHSMMGSRHVQTSKERADAMHARLTPKEYAAYHPDGSALPWTMIVMALMDEIEDFRSHPAAVR